MSKRSIFYDPMKLVGAAGLLCAALLMGQSSFAQTSIVNSKHDLSSSATHTGTKVTTGTNELCAFCHTPHGASADAPLWNRGPSVTTSFTLYTSASMDGTAIQPTLSPARGSNLCLSCHDGATALDLLINAPGSGWDGSGGGTSAPISRGYVWQNVTGTNQMLAGSIANIGTVLANDHPIGIPYCGGATTGACKDPDFKTTALYKNGTLTSDPTAASTDNFWIDVAGVVGTREKGDLPLYVRTFGTTDYASVECATCHEPHGSGNTMFLRKANAQSALCTSCHNK